MTNHTATASARTAAAVAASPPPPPGLSLFERLPAELRLQIYDLLFASEDVPAQPQQPMHNHQDPTYQAPSHEGPAHAKHTNTAAAVLSLNKRINADATPALYARPVFELKVRPTGIMLCGGRSLSLSLPLAQNHSSPQHQNPSQAKDSSQAKGSSQAQSPFLPLLAHARNLNIHIIAFLQPSMYARTLAHLHALTRALRTHNAPLRSLRFAIDWHNGSLAFPVRQPDFAMARAAAV
ncbi:uncharacterized protein K452DRAFT_301134 [Aplosporella prunicola CBS 121167]|uniref:Uncharacterized protein n=1 Tax=Aplosporella prunicola CBS 121167 TaxID=1176127 RepID=A0A6A6B5B7_9PEZI|nr:uncharacterized protein K452DRAFT_301134 [Aplosporella prunicola CBS 121167]KAF2138613.1 hypothetical protein K452DRAFT_301134 [Aplosporella prunicola CBS 121167]